LILSHNKLRHFHKWKVWRCEIAHSNEVYDSIFFADLIIFYFIIQDRQLLVSLPLTYSLNFFVRHLFFFCMNHWFGNANQRLSTWVLRTRGWHNLRQHEVLIKFQSNSRETSSLLSSAFNVVTQHITAHRNRMQNSWKTSRTHINLYLEAIKLRESSDIRQRHVQLLYTFKLTHILRDRSIRCRACHRPIKLDV